MEASKVLVLGNENFLALLKNTANYQYVLSKTYNDALNKLRNTHFEIVVILYSQTTSGLLNFAKSLNTADQVCLLDFPKNAVREDETIAVTIQDLMDRCPNAILLDVDDASAEKLKTLAPAAFVFMSSKDIYLLRDKLEKIL